MPTLMLTWVVPFPTEAPLSGRVALAWPWSFGLVYGALHRSYLFAGPALLPQGHQENLLSRAGHAMITGSR